MENSEQVYMDNAAATRMDDRVLEAMKPYFFETYAVATSEFAYSQGIEASEALGGARTVLSGALGGTPEEFIFTSGGTESSNIAIKGMAIAAKNRKHLITSKIEDFPVLNSAKALEKQGFRVTYLDVDGDGFIDPAKLREAISEETFLVSLQHANQEIGTIRDIATLGAVCREKKVPFHTDATHTFGRVEIDVRTMPIDLITVDANMIHGPKGVGGLYVRKGTKLGKWMDGGFQEFDLRAGAENIPGAIGFARAIELITPEETAKIQEIRDRIIDRILAEIPDTTLNGHREKRLPQNTNISFHYIEGESITLHLDMNGYAVSTGSACFSRSLEGSHVIYGIGGDHERAHGSIRFTLGRYNTAEEADGITDVLKDIVSELRSISPLARDKYRKEK